MIYTVEEITNYIKELIESDEFLINISVKGEISNVRKVDNNIYFTLKDAVSMIDCAMFSRSALFLDFVPEEGMNVVVRGSVEVYRRKGSYQLVVEEMKQDGKGDLYKKFLGLKEKLAKEGLFDKERKKPFPLFPKNIGIITSIEGAALQDMLKVFQRKIPANLFIYHSLVQGEKAVLSIAKGIRLFNILEHLNVELIIIARGGGSYEDLFVFNEEIIAREIFNSKIPIITGIGHETDFTISDFVADYSASTPTAAANYVLLNREDIEIKISEIKYQLYNSFKKILEYYKKELKFSEEKTIFKKPFIKIIEYKQLLDDKQLLLNKVLNNNIKIFKKGLEYSENVLYTLNPQAILNRGYSITTKDGEIVTVEQLTEHDDITTIFKNGKIESRVTKKIKNENL